jgi:exonuclease III
MRQPSFEGKEFRYSWWRMRYKRERGNRIVEHSFITTNGAVVASQKLTPDSVKITVSDHLCKD